MFYLTFIYKFKWIIIQTWKHLNCLMLPSILVVPLLVQHFVFKLMMAFAATSHQAVRGNRHNLGYAKKEKVERKTS